MADTLRLTILQPPGHLPDPAERLRWLAEALADIAARGAHMVLLPELFATGYAIGDAVRERAEPADGAFAASVGALARRHGLAIHYGYAERSGSALYSAAQCFGPDGEVLTRHRKQLIPPGFETGYFRPGEGFHLFRFREITMTTLICYEVEFPETVRHCASLGAKVVLAPTALASRWGWVARTMIPTRAYENGVFLAYANHAGTERGLRYLGESVIAAPDGEELARATGEPGSLLADLDMARVAAAQARLPYLSDCRRLVLE